MSRIDHQKSHPSIVKFPVREESKLLRRKFDDRSKAIDYYVTGRFNYFHSMIEVAAINFFWAAEYLLRSLLDADVREIQERFKGHALTSQWGKIKADIDTSQLSEKIDRIIANVEQYRNLRFSEDILSEIIVYSKIKKPATVENEGHIIYYHVNIDEIDQLFHYLYREYPGDQNYNLLKATIESTTKTKDIYMRENRFSVFIVE